MHFISKYISLLLLFPLFCGCKKVIDVSLNNAAPQMVINGEVNNGAGPYSVYISQSANYTASNNFPPVSGALVTISGNGITDSLTETAPGIYITHSIVGKPGSSYTMNVLSGGKVYTAISVMPQPVTLDSIGFKTSADGKTIYAQIFFPDPAGIANYYRFIEYKAGKQFANNRGWFVFDDRLSDGRYINITLFDDSTDIQTGDTLTMQMNCVDKSVYNYLFELNELVNANGFNSPAPANPDSNISNGALGYFTAQTVQKKSIVVY